MTEEEMKICEKAVIEEITMYYNNFVTDTHHWSQSRMSAYARGETAKAAWDEYCAAVDRGASLAERERLYALFRAAERGKRGHVWYCPPDGEMMVCARCGQEPDCDIDAGHRFTMS